MRRARRMPSASPAAAVFALGTSASTGMRTSATVAARLELARIATSALRPTQLSSWVLTASPIVFAMFAPIASHAFMSSVSLAKPVNAAACARSNPPPRWYIDGCAERATSLIAVRFDSLRIMLSNFLATLPSASSKTICALVT